MYTTDYDVSLIFVATSCAVSIAIIPVATCMTFGCGSYASLQRVALWHKQDITNRYTAESRYHEVLQTDIQLNLDTSKLFRPIFS